MKYENPNARAAREAFESLFKHEDTRDDVFTLRRFINKAEIDETKLRKLMVNLEQVTVHQKEQNASFERIKAAVRIKMDKMKEMADTLKFYANAHNYKAEFGELRPEVHVDGGKRARAIIESIVIMEAQDDAG